MCLLTFRLLISEREDDSAGDEQNGRGNTHQQDSLRPSFIPSQASWSTFMTRRKEEWMDGWMDGRDGHEGSECGQHSTYQLIIYVT